MHSENSKLLTMLWPWDANSVGNQLPKPKKPMEVSTLASVSITIRDRHALSKMPGALAIASTWRS